MFESQSKLSTSSAYPEKAFTPLPWLDQVAVQWGHSLRRRLQPFSKEAQRLVREVNRLGEEYLSASEIELTVAVSHVRAQLAREGLAFSAVARAFALIRELADRRLGMRHYDVQLMGGFALIKGMVAEMETGEGKTLAATLAVATAAMADIPVHVITVNDYLAERDGQIMKPLYEALGLSVGVVCSGLSPAQRRQAYGCDVTYCTNKEVVFDYLKDRISLGADYSYVRSCVERLYQEDAAVDRMLLRGLHFAIVDEADSIFIDEARVPVVISSTEQRDEEALVVRQAIAVAQEMVRGREFEIDSSNRVILKAAAYERLIRMGEELGSIWCRARWRESQMELALTALHLFNRDRQYIVEDGKIQIIDEFTGRIMEDRAWEQGLQQMIEAKEGVPLSGRREVLARTSYQHFFRRYLRLAGMTGTVTEAAGELGRVYGLGVARIPTNRPGQRRQVGKRACHTLEEKWSRVVAACREQTEQGRPVLAGTRTVESSEILSRLLTEAGIAHAVLNARQDKTEAEIIARAGEAGRVTVATNMAGRGTDIMLAPEAKEAGGLHVIVTERHEASRIDRQLIGRCGRQGDPGSYEVLVSAEDDLLQQYMGSGWGKMSSRRFIKPFITVFIRFAQKEAERRHAGLRRELLKSDEQVKRMLAFAGGRE